MKLVCRARSYCGETADSCGRDRQRPRCGGPPVPLLVTYMPDDTASATDPAGSRLRFELILGSALLAIGLFALPAAVFYVGSGLLGPYGEKAGVGTFYADFFGDLASASGRAWALALGPLVLVSWVRLLFMRRPVAPSEDEAPPPRVRPASEAASRRVEPRVSLEP